MTQINEGFGDIPQSKILIIPIIDVSGSMTGERIAAVNEAMFEVPQQLSDISQELLDCAFYIAPMKFSTEAEWFGLTDGQPTPVEKFSWVPLTTAGLTNLGAAFDLLYPKLTTTELDGWMERGGCVPIIILISDGEPTDAWRTSLYKLKNKTWFRYALKFAVAVGEDAGREALASFTGTYEALIDTEVVRKDLATLVKKVVICSSKSQAKPESRLLFLSEISDEPENARISGIIKDILNDDDDLF